MRMMVTGSIAMVFWVSHRLQYAELEPDLRRC